MIVESIHSLDDSRLDEFRELKRTNATRHSAYFIAEGRLVVARLLASHFSVRAVLLSDKRWSAFSPYIPEGTRVLRVSHELCSRLVGFDFHAGVMASVNRAPLRQVPAQFVAGMHCGLVCCPETSLPDNLGSIMRLAAAFETAGLLVGPGSADPFSRRAVRVSMGAVFRLPVIEPHDLVDELHRLKSAHGFAIVAMGRGTGTIALGEFVRRIPPQWVLVFGNEARGLDNRWLQLADYRVEIEMSSDVDSINVAAAAAIGLYELTRRRG